MLIFESFWIENFWNFENSKINFQNFTIWKIIFQIQIVKFWKFDNFRNWIILGVGLFSRLVNNENLIIFEIIKFGKLAYFSNWNFFEFSELEIFGIFQIGNFWNLANRKFMKFFIFEIKKFPQCKNLKNKNFLDSNS